MKPAAIYCILGGFLLAIVIGVYGDSTPAGSSPPAENSIAAKSNNMVLGAPGDGRATADIISLREIYNKSDGSSSRPTTSEEEDDSSRFTQVTIEEQAERLDEENYAQCDDPAMLKLMIARLILKSKIQQKRIEILDADVGRTLVAEFMRTPFARALGEKELEFASSFITQIQEIPPESELRKYVECEMEHRNDFWNYCDINAEIRSKYMNSPVADELEKTARQEWWDRSERRSRRLIEIFGPTRAKKYFGDN